MNIYLVIFITLVAALIASFAQLTYKLNIGKGINNVTDILRVFKKKRVLMGLGGYAIGLVVYLYALSEAPLSIVYPTFASTFIFITLISVFYLKEELNTKRIIGVGLVFLGILVIAATL
jgi:drug/metabolite transporter (DMT)-like permease